MSKSPGHRQHPEHTVREERLDVPVRVTVNGIPVANSDDAIRVIEDEHPPRIYLPREDVQMSCLQRTQTTTECPFKGHANYYTLMVAGQEFPDAIWTYEDPFDEHADLKDRVAFDSGKYPEIQVETGMV